MRLKIKRLICILAAVSATSMALPANAVSPVLLASEKQETMFYDGTDKGFILKDKEAVTDGDMVYESSEKAVSEADIAKAIETARRVLPDTSVYDKFDYTTRYLNGEYGQETVINLNYRNDDGYAKIAVNTDGFVSSFNKSYKKSGSKVPLIHKADAVETAYSFIAGANPGFEQYFSADRAVVTYNRGSETYTVAFTPAGYDGVELSAGGASVTLSHQTGEVYAFAMNMPSPLDTEYAKLPADTDVREAFAQKLPMQLKFKVKYDNDTQKNYVDLVYTPSDINGIILSDLKLYSPDYINSFYFKYANSAIRNDAVTADKEKSEDISLTDAEIRGIEYQDTFIKPEEVAEILSGNLMISFNPENKIASSSLTKSVSRFTEKESYCISVNYESGDGEYSHAKINAETGDILYYYSYSEKPIGKYEEVTIDKLPYTADEYTNTARSFIENNYADTCKEFVWDGETFANSTLCPDYGINFTFVRYNQGLAFNNDSINITVDPTTKKVTAIRYNYSDCTFPSADGIISKEDALGIYAEKVGFTPILFPAVKISDGTVYIAENDTSSAQKRLFAGYRYSLPYYEIDAHTGECEDVQNSTDYFINTAFTDITDEETLKIVTALSDMDIIERDTLFFPDEEITWGEYAKIVAHLGNIPELYANKGDSTPIYGENYSPDEKLTRADMVKAAVYALGYSKSADLCGIYVTGFSDDADIDDSYKGYVAIAKALGYLDGFGEAFQGSQTVSRAEAVKFIYAPAAE